MAHAPEDIRGDRYARILLLGRPKSGKSTCAVGTAPAPVRVILCESDSALVPVKRVTRNFTFDRALDFDSTTSAILAARRAVKAGAVKTIVLDPLSTLGEHLLDEALAVTKNDPRRAYPMVQAWLRQIVEQLVDIPAHVVVVCHYIAGSKGDENEQLKADILPMLPGGKAQELIPSIFNDVVWFHYDARTGRRVMKVNPRGVFGPGGRSFREARDIEADVHAPKKRVGISAFIRQMHKERERLEAEDAAAQNEGGAAPSEEAAGKKEKE